MRIEKGGDGTYAYEMDGQYYFAHSERGEIYDSKTTKCEERIDFLCLDYYVKNFVFFTHYRMGFTVDYTRETGFESELHIFSKISEKMYQRKKKDIDRILYATPVGHNFTFEEIDARYKEYDEKYGILSSGEKLVDNSQKTDVEEQKIPKNTASARLRSYLKKS